MESSKIKEYESLRAEILQKIELHNTLLTFTITTTVASLTFALSKDSIIFYFIPFCILLPMSTRIAYYRSAMAKLSAYIMVFIERGEKDGLNWETRNNDVLCKTMTNRKKEGIIHNLNSECLILSIICYFFFALAYYRDKQLQHTFVSMLLGACPLILVVIEGIITKLSSISTNKKIWINKWEMLQREYNKQSSDGA